jgi:hypothetical protein
MLPLTPPSVLFHENLTASPPGETEPLPVPIVVQAVSPMAAHRMAVMVLDMVTPYGNSLEQSSGFFWVRK